jgi:hypothetical protein
MQQDLPLPAHLPPIFSDYYLQLQALPRRFRRALQRQWKKSLAGIALMLALGLAPALAATIKVNGACTLSRAITSANRDASPSGSCTPGRGADRIVLPRGSTHILKKVNNTTYGPTGLPVIRSDITIDGNNSTIRRARSAPEFRICAVAQNDELTLRNTTVSGGRAADEGGLGGGVYGYESDIKIVNSTISGNVGHGVSGLYTDLEVINSAVTNNRGYGVIDASPETGLGSVTVANSTIARNSRAGLYGESSDIEGINTTISGNANGVEGGGHEGLDLKLVHSTITANHRAGIAVRCGEYGSRVVVQRCLISGNGKGREIVVDECRSYYDTSVTTGDFNVFGHSGNDGLKGCRPGLTDIVPVQPVSGVLNTTLAPNGGQTETHALVPGSPAIDAINDGTCPPPTSDQRGIARPRDGNRDGVLACDTGSFEAP